MNLKIFSGQEHGNTYPSTCPLDTITAIQIKNEGRFLQPDKQFQDQIWLHKSSEF